MKALLMFSLLAISITVVAQTPENYVPSYTLDVPKGWGVEHISLPLDFAPSIPYKGVEDLRFAPGWSDPKAGDYWTYSFLWNLEGKPDITPEATEKNLTAYYTGLIGRNIEPRKIPKEKLVPVKVSIKKVKTEAGDLQTWSGTIDMLDYMAQKPITLNAVVHMRSCPDKDNLFMFYQISPQASTHEIWKELKKLWESFECEKK